MAVAEEETETGEAAAEGRAAAEASPVVTSEEVQWEARAVAAQEQVKVAVGMGEVAATGAAMVAARARGAAAARVVAEEAAETEARSEATAASAA